MKRARVAKHQERFNERFRELWKDVVVVQVLHSMIARDHKGMQYCEHMLPDHGGGGGGGNYNRS